MHKLVVRSNKHNKTILQKRGISFSDHDALKTLAKEIKSTKHFILFTLDIDELNYLKQLFESIGLKVDTIR